jgi:glycosyltransferase
MKFSIITATLNSAAYLDECIAAVLSQHHHDFEHIVIDGGSIDGTLALARRHSHVRAVELPGSTIYEAWNAGLDIASGDLIGICNSDDLYAPGAFAAACRAMEVNRELWMVSGQSVLFRREPDGETTIIEEYSDKMRNRFHFVDTALFGSAINARFLTRKLVTRFGKFDTRFRLASDCSYMMEVALAQLPVATIDAVVYYYRSHDRSTSLGGNLSTSILALDEKLTIAQEFLTDPRLGVEERRHLQRAMAMQFNATVVEHLRDGKWGSGLALVGRLGRFGLAGVGGVIAEAGRLAARRLFRASSASATCA